MSIPTVKTALANAQVQSQDINCINCIVFVSHQPFPFPPFTAHLMIVIGFHRDCSQIPVTSMGCGSGGFALDAALNYLRANTDHKVLVLCLELCSLGFRPHKNGKFLYFPLCYLYFLYCSTWAMNLTLQKRDTFFLKERKISRSLTRVFSLMASSKGFDEGKKVYSIL